MPVIYQPKGAALEYSPFSRPREKNGFWKGGRTITSNGYVLIRVGVSHPLADCRGYAYEHRVVASDMLGRLITKGELVHHIDGNKQNNHRSNLKIEASIFHHKTEHRNGKKKLRMPGEENPTIECMCGCGQKINKYDKYNRPRMYAQGCSWRKGKKGGWNV